jgi:hypothetical protein
MAMIEAARQFEARKNDADHSALSHDGVLRHSVAEISCVCCGQRHLIEPVTFQD